MWFIFKFAAMLTGFFISRLRKVPEPDTNAIKNLKAGNETCYISHIRGKHSVRATEFKIAFPRKSTFKIKAETFVDKIAKSLGLSTELQIGKKEFDRKIYLQTDTEKLIQEIKDSELTQSLIMALIEKGCVYIAADGKSLIARFKGKSDDEVEISEFLAGIAIELKNKPSAVYSLSRDPHFFKVVALESFIMGIAWYGFIGLVGSAWGDDDWIIDYGELAIEGVVFSSKVILVMIVLVFLVLRKSSRSHRLIMENMFALFIGFPLAGVTMAGDINVLLDTSKPQIAEIKITGKRQEVRTTRKGRRITTLYIDFDYNDAYKYNLPANLKVDQEMYNDLKTFPVNAKISIGKGRLKKRYVKGIKI